MMLSAAVAAGVLPSIARADRPEGIDASQFQGNVNWVTVHAPKASGGGGKDFAIIRSTRGGTTGVGGSGGTTGTGAGRYDDPSFSGFMSAAKSAGMIIGPYHFSRVDRYDPLDPNGTSGNLSSPEDEARHFLEIAGPYMKVGYLHPMLDLEAGATNTTPAQMSDWVNRFVNTIVLAKGINAQPSIYLNTSYATSEVDTSVNYLTLWLARPSTASDSQNGDPITPNGFAHPYGVWGNADPKPWTFWQYDIPSVDPNPIMVPGVQNEVDLDVVHGDATYLNSQKIQGVVWTGATNAIYDPGTNWTSGVEPTANDEVLFDTTIPATGPNITLTAGENARAIYFANSYSLNGGNLTLSNGRIDVDAGKTVTIATTLQGTSGFRKVGPGTLVLTSDIAMTGNKTIAGGVLSIDNASRLGNAVSTLTLDDGTLQQTNPAAGSALVNSNISLSIGRWGGTIDYNIFAGITSYTGTITGGGGTTGNGGANTLTKTGQGELRYQSAGLANTTFKKLVVKGGGMFRLALFGSAASEHGFGAAPTAFLPDAITLDGGAIGTTFATTTDVNRGMILGAGGGIFDCTLGAMTFTGIISGTTGGTLTARGTLGLTGVNFYAGDTIIGDGVNPTTLTINNVNSIGDTPNNVIFNLGTLKTAAAINLGRNFSINAGGGTFDTNGFDSNIAAVSGSGNTFTKVSAGRLTLNSVRVAALSITGGTLQVAPNGSSTGVSKLTGLLTISPGAKLDLSDNKLITTNINPVGTWNGSSYTGVTGMIAAGRSGNSWTGSGIITSQSNAHLSNFTTLGVAKASDVRSQTTSTTAIWAGQTITGTDTLVMYTYGGDATLDGQINIDDYVRIDNGLAAHLRGWSNGDFNYDGKINVDDYTTMIDANIGTQGPPFYSGGGITEGGSGLSAVPEPSLTAIAAAGLAAATVRRRRKR